MLQEIGEDGEKENLLDPSKVLNAMTLQEEGCYSTCNLGCVACIDW